jgi:IclR family acetate operon transcriptional repressor
MSEIQTLARGLQIINALADAQDGLSITELGERFGVDKGNMSRFLQTLANYGFAEKAADTRRYYLGPQVVRLSRSLLTRMKLRETAKPFLDELVKATGECAHLAILAQGQALYIDQAESPSALRVTTGVGTMAPLHCTALGKVLLAFANAPAAEHLNSFTIRTITDHAALQGHLERVRKQGYAIDDEEFDAGVRCIAVPVCDYRDRCVAAIGVSGPTSRMSLESLPKVAQAVQEIGRSLSARLSFKLNGGSCG